MSTAAITFYAIVKFVHVAAVVLAFGPTFGYAFLQGIAESTAPRSLPTVWRTILATDRYLVTPAATVLLIAGVVLVIDGDWDWSAAFVGVGVVGIVVLLGLVGGFFIPHDRRLMELAERDLAAAAPGAEVELSAEYLATSKRYARIGMLTGLLILAIIFLMVVKP